jgi:hypothetical protein
LAYLAACHKKHPANTGLSEDTARSPLVEAKRLLLAILAASTIALDAQSRATEFRQAGLHVVLASVLVWLPATVYFIIGPSGDELVGDAKRWLLANQRTVSFYLALSFGLLFTVEPAVNLLA